MFISHVSGQKPEILDLPKEVKIIFLGKTNTENFFLITSPKNFTPEEGTDNLVDFTPAGLIAFYGAKNDFMTHPIINGCMITKQGFAHGKELFFSFHGEKGSREYYLAGHSFKEVFIPL